MKYLDFVVRNMPTFRDRCPSFIACAILYQSRKDEISRLKMKVDNPEEEDSIQKMYWCQELEQMTSYSEKELKDYGRKIKRKHYGKMTPSEKKRKNKENLSQKQTPCSVSLANKFAAATSIENSINK